MEREASSYGRTKTAAAVAAKPVMQFRGGKCIFVHCAAGERDGRNKGGKTLPRIAIHLHKIHSTAVDRASLTLGPGHGLFVVNSWTKDTPKVGD